MDEADASPASLNKLRAIVHSVFEQAIAAGKWRGVNPISSIPTRKVPQRIYETLSLDEVRQASMRPVALGRVGYKPRPHEEIWRNSRQATRR